MSKFKHQSKYEFHRNIAIIIGINEYKNDVTRLETAVPDAEEFARIMQEQYQYEIHLLLNEDATLDKLKQLINCFHNKKIPFGQDPEITEKDRILIYFAGHGKALDAKEKQEGPVGYLIPQDATDNVDTYLKMQDFHDALLKLPCRHLLVILDCCFSGAFYWSSINRDVVPKVKLFKQVYDHYIKYRAWQVITSTSDKQTAIDSPPRGEIIVGSKIHSPFAKHLFDVLKKNDDYDGGIITANDLYRFLRQAVAVETEEYKAQTPGICPLKLHDNGEYLFLLPGEPILEEAPVLRLEDSPYRGLESYEKEHQKLFCGRKEQIEQLYEKVNNFSHRALTVVLGASGTGKSSLVKAGLIPFLEDQKDPKDKNIQPNLILQKWIILKPVRLGESPLTELRKYFDQELNLTSYNPNFTQFQTNKTNWFKGVLDFLGFGIQPNNSQHNQKLEKEVELLSQSLDNWFKENSDSTLLITIDQFEELITLQPRQEQKTQNKKKKVKKVKVKEKTQQELVLKWLPQIMSQYGDRLRIILTVRSDFESQFQDGDLQKYWTEEARFHIKEMTTAELREAITKPASEKSIFFVPNTLIDKLVDEVAGMPGTLPLLSFTLNELYRIFVEEINNEGKDDRAITEEYYNRLGGVTRALTQKAEEEYKQLVNKDKAYEQTIRRVMLRMVAVSGGELARRRVLVESELKYPEPENSRVHEVVKNFVKARLLVEGENAEKKSYVEPAHDALVRGWDRLLKWQQEEKENLILQRQLTPAAVEWKLERAQSNGYLWHNNPRLDLLKKELKSKDNWFNELEIEFVQCSIGRKKINTNIARIVAISVIAGLSTGLIASLIGQRNALISQIRSSQQASEANLLSNQQFNALINSLRAAKTLKDWPWYLSLFKPEHQISFLFKSDDKLQPQVLKTLRKVYYIGKEHFRLKLVSAPGSARSDFWVKDSDSDNLHDWKLMIATTTQEPGSVRLLDLKNNSETTFQAHNDKVEAISFNPNINQLATLSQKGTINFWDLKGRNTAPPIFIDRGGNNFIMEHFIFSPDGKKIAITVINTNPTYAKIVFLCNLASRLCESFKESEDETLGIGFTINNEIIVATKTDELVKILDWSGKTIAAFSMNNLGNVNIYEILFNPNGKEAVIFAGQDSSSPYWLNWSGFKNQTKLEPKAIDSLKQAIDSLKSPQKPRVFHLMEILALMVKFLLVEEEMALFTCGLSIKVFQGHIS